MLEGKKKKITGLNSSTVPLKKNMQADIYKKVS